MSDPLGLLVREVIS